MKQSPQITTVTSARGFQHKQSTYLAGYERRFGSMTSKSVAEYGPEPALVNATTFAEYVFPVVRLLSITLVIEAFNVICAKILLVFPLICIWNQHKRQDSSQTKSQVNQADTYLVSQQDSIVMLRRRRRPMYKRRSSVEHSYLDIVWRS